MKLLVQKNEHSESVTLEVPSSLSLAHLGVGEKFTVFLVAEDKSRTQIEACFLADKRSLLVGDSVVRFDKKCTFFKAGNYGLSFSLQGRKTLNHFNAHIIRPVEPKKSLSNGLFGPVLSPMTGKIVSVLFKDEDEVCLGDTLVIIEAMKMENRILAQANGIVKNTKALVGASVVSNDILLTLVEKPAV